MMRIEASEVSVYGNYTNDNEENDSIEKENRKKNKNVKIENSVDDKITFIITGYPTSTANRAASSSSFTSPVTDIKCFNS